MRILILLFVPFSVFAEPATLSFDPSVTPQATYNVYKNDVLINSGISLVYDVNKLDGDVFYVRSELDGVESMKSNVKLVPHTPAGVTITTTTTTVIRVQ